MIRSLESSEKDGNNAIDTDGDSRCSQLEHFTERTRLPRPTLVTSGSIVMIMLVATMISLIAMGPQIVLRLTRCSPGKIGCSSHPTDFWGGEKQPRYTRPLDELVQGDDTVGDVRDILDFAVIG